MKNFRFRRTGRTRAASLIFPGILIALFFAPSLILARQGSPNEAQSLIDTMIESLGGREAIGGLRTLAVEADCTGPGGPFRTRVESFRPDSVYFSQQAGDSSTEIWSTGSKTWRRDGRGGIQELGERERFFVRSHEFHLLLFDLETRFSEFVLGDTAIVDGQPGHRIEMKDSMGNSASVSVSDSEGLPQTLELNPPGAQGPIRIHFRDWEEIDGVRYFRSFLLTEGPERRFTYAYREIVPNGVAADRFALPVRPALQADQDAIPGASR